MKIIAVNWYGDVDTRRFIDHNKYTRTRIECPEYGLRKLDKYDDVTQLRMLLADLSIEVITDEFTYVFNIRKGYLTDFASVPEKLRSIVDNDSYYMVIAALCHDVIYSTNELPRSEADELLAGIIKYLGSGAVISFLVYAAVRIGGGFHFDHSPARIQYERKYAQTIKIKQTLDTFNIRLVK